MLTAAYQEACKAIGHASPSTVLLQALGDADTGSTPHLHLPSKGALIPTAVGYTLTAKDIEALCSALGKTATTIKSLNLANLAITDKDCKGIAALIQATSTLEDLDLTGTDFGGAGLAEISRAVAKNKSLIKLTLKACKFGGSSGVNQLVEALHANDTLEELNVANTDLDVNDFIQFATVLSQTNALRKVNLDRTLLLAVGQEEVASHVADILRRNTCLEHVSFKKYGFGDFGAGQIAKALEANDSIKHIDLSCNKIGRDGATSLGNMLMKNSTIEGLNLDNNIIEDEGLLAICNSLLQCQPHTLQFLGVASNHILGLAGHRTGHVYHSGLTYFANAVPTITSLTHFHIWGNPSLCAVGKLDTDALKAVSELLETKDYRCDVHAYTVDGQAYIAFKDDQN